MLSQSAKDGFELLLTQSLKSSLAPSGVEAQISTPPDMSDFPEKQMVVLTVSSYLFRLMVMFYFTPNAATRNHFARLNNIDEAEMSEQSFMDAIAESGNLCCGILNRDLGNFFPHIGMSTPNVIDKNCAAYLQKLNCQHVRHFAVDMDGSPRFHVSLCVSAYADIDFSVSAEELGSDTGELELF
ncbi:hypothetical protein PMI16_01718 [Herbaspirillum sp. CF444]|uniref:hypothetical protein n=1 Tax=Herbaspirillum sp. CF444 TaxID=1144319 RepID=UPI00027283BA|nr:hypothetical protein [Herbaspirillum sp. CF444]EJL90878.1 hypothetical protein PMI16_01718 [Herbaspirillum sp. CF444]